MRVDSKAKIRIKLEMEYRIVIIIFTSYCIYLIRADFVHILKIGENLSNTYIIMEIQAVIVHNELTCL